MLRDGAGVLAGIGHMAGADPPISGFDCDDCPALARGRSVDTPELTVVAAGSCGRIGQYVPGIPPSSAVVLGSRVTADVSRILGTGVNPRPFQELIAQCSGERAKPGAKARAPAALSDNAITVITSTRRNMVRSIYDNRGKLKGSNCPPRVTITQNA